MAVLNAALRGNGLADDQNNVRGFLAQVGKIYCPAANGGQMQNGFTLKPLRNLNR